MRQIDGYNIANIIISKGRCVINGHSKVNKLHKTFMTASKLYANLLISITWSNGIYLVFYETALLCVFRN